MPPRILRPSRGPLMIQQRSRRMLKGPGVAHKSGTDQIEEAKQRVKEVPPADAMRMSESDPSIVYLDVREPNEWNLGRIPGALFIARGNLESRIESTIPREKKIIIYCARGNRS